MSYYVWNILNDLSDTRKYITARPSVYVQWFPSSSAEATVPQGKQSKALFVL